MSQAIFSTSGFPHREGRLAPPDGRNVGLLGHSESEIVTFEGRASMAEDPTSEVPLVRGRLAKSEITGMPEARLRSPAIMSFTSRGNVPPFRLTLLSGIETAVAVIIITASRLFLIVDKARAKPRGCPGDGIGPSVHAKASPRAAAQKGRPESIDNGLVGVPAAVLCVSFLHELGPASKATLSTSSLAFLRSPATSLSEIRSGLNSPQVCTVFDHGTPSFTGYS
jgi:hypothetical protein